MGIGGYQSAFQLTAARRRLGGANAARGVGSLTAFQLTAARRRLAANRLNFKLPSACFNSQPPGGGWEASPGDIIARGQVSTHSRPEAAGLHAR